MESRWDHVIVSPMDEKRACLEDDDLRPRPVRTGEEEEEEEAIQKKEGRRHSWLDWRRIKTNVILSSFCVIRYPLLRFHYNSVCVNCLGAKAQ